MPRLDITIDQIERTTNRLTSVDANFEDSSTWTDEKYPTAAALQKVLSDSVVQNDLVQNALTQLTQVENRLDSLETDLRQELVDTTDNVQVDITEIKANITEIETDIAAVKTDIVEVKNRIENETVKTATYVVTVANSWDMDNGYYYQTLTVPGILATDNPVVDISTGEDNAANVLYGEAMCKVFRITTEDNSIIVWAKEAINIAFPIQLKVVR